MLQTLRAKIQLLFVLLILSMGVLVVAWFALIADQSVDNRIQQDVEGATRALASLISVQKESLLQRVSLLSEHASLHHHSGRSASQELKADLRLLRSDAVAFLDSRGRIHASAGFKNGPNPQTMRAAHQAGVAGRPWSGVVHLDGRPMIAASSPVREGNAVVGTVVAGVVIDRALAKRLRDASGSEIVFVRKGKPFAASMRVESALPVKEGRAKVVRLGGESYVGQYRSLPGTRTEQGFGFVALQEFESVVAPLRSLGVMFVTGLLGALGAAIVLTGAFSRSLSRPLDALMKAAEDVRDGRWPEPLEIAARDEIGVLQAAFNDMTASLKTSQDRLLAMIDADPLTELDNHRRFKERLDQEVFRACMAEKPLAVVLFDVDRFAEYNTQFGHAAGDDALRMVAQILRENAPDIAFLARYGGEEFAMLLPMNSLASAEVLANRARTALEGRFLAQVTMSAGVAELSPGITSGAGLLLSAELALSRAKQLGKDRVCRFDAVPGAADESDPFQLQRYLEDSTFAAIQALAGAVDAKDPYTQGHSLRVAKYASDLAKYMGEPPSVVDLVYRTGTLHDVGKIGVPDSILTKPARLDAEELAIMETHPVLGELIVKRAPQLDDMLPGVRHHHERWDGRGYPDRLMGDQIPRLARFIAIADTFDAMTSDRPYRKALPFEVALDEIQRNAGIQFDPTLAHAFVRMVRLHGQHRLAA